MQTDTLLTIAEVAAGFIGFSAIATIFLGRDSTEDMMRFKAIVLLCLIAIWASFLPIWIDRYLEPASIWRWATICTFVLFLPYMLWITIQFREMEVGTATIKISGIGTFATVGGVVAMLIAVPGAIVQISGWPIAGNQGVYELMLCCLLSLVTFVFIDLIVIHKGT